jgi:hypothetical protein
MCMLTRKIHEHVDIHIHNTCIHTYRHTSTIRAYIHTYIHPQYMHTYIHTYIHPQYVHTYRYCMYVHMRVLCTIHGAMDTFTV